MKAKKARPPAKQAAQKASAGKTVAKTAAKAVKKASPTKAAKPAPKGAKAAPKKPVGRTAPKAAAKPVRPAPKPAAKATAKKSGKPAASARASKPADLGAEQPAQGEPLTASETAALLDHVRAIVNRLPDTTEVEAWGHPTFRVNNKIFVGYGVENGTASLGVKTTPDMQAALVSSDPRFSIAAYVGKHGWVSMSLAGAVDLAEVEALVRGSYRLVAPSKLVRKLDEAEG